jgi:hypothetical protein
VAVAYLVKHPTVHRNNRVRGPQRTQKWLIVQRIRILHYECSDESSNLSKPAIRMNSLMEKHPTSNGKTGSSTLSSSSDGL